VTPDEAREFVSTNHRAVLITYRRRGLQTSPVTVGIDVEGKVVISSRESAYKVRNLRRNPTATMCVISDAFFGSPWVQIEGRTEIVSLPEAMEGLIDYYRGISGEHPDWSDYRRAMERDRRVLLRVAIDRVGPKHFG
jgi:PPOX class probable F420-dependent enzyme